MERGLAQRSTVIPIHPDTSTLRAQRTRRIQLPLQVKSSVKKKTTDPIWDEVLTLPTVDAKTGRRYAVDNQIDDDGDGCGDSDENEDGGVMAVSLSGFNPAAAEADDAPVPKQMLEIVVDGMSGVHVVS